MAHSQSSGEQTVQIDVLPGRVTGVYYIPVSSLPFHTSWQQFKDWVRQACEVDHVQLFDKSASGWVRVRGKKNFLKALEYISSQQYQDRALLADGRNEKQTIKIKQPYDLPTTSGSRKPERPITQPSSPTRSNSPVPSYSYAYQEEEVYEPQYSMPAVKYRSAYGYPEVSSYDYRAAVPRPMTCAAPYAEYYTSHASPSEPWSGAKSIYMQPQYPMHSHPAYSTPTPSSQYASQEESHQARVVLKNLPHKCSHNDIEAWVRRRFGSHDEAFAGVVIPLDEKNECTRGRAHVILRSAEYAPLAIRKLHRKEWKNRTITATLVTVDDRSEEMDTTVTRHRTKSSRSKTGESSSPAAGSSGSSLRKHRSGRSSSLSKEFESRLVIAKGTTDKGKNKAR